MLAAVGISSAIGFDGGDYVLRVDAAEAAAAYTNLRSYEGERRAAAAARTRHVAARPPLRPAWQAWLGCALYAAVLLGVDLAMANGWWRLDAFTLGELDAAQLQRGQLWRALTALSLHLDGPHLAANLAVGVWFGYLAARELGAGHAWLLTVIGAGLANWFEGRFGPGDHRAVGASTAVFAALGLLAAHAWGARRQDLQGWARRGAPLVAGAVLLGWFGSAGEGTDIVAHALGFAFGCLLGAGAALPAAQRLLRRLPQWLSGAAALAALAVAWRCALALG